LLLAHTRAEPDLSALPAEDRPVVARALSKDPEQRFACCLDLVRALLKVKPAAPPEETPTCADLLLPLADADQPPLPDDALSPPLEEEAQRLTLPAPASADTDALMNQALGAYQFHDCLGSSPLADTWRAQSPDGRARLVQFIYGFTC